MRSARRYEIIGNIASGKTTLARLLEGSAILLLENFKENPFWEAFYKDPHRNCFETEITFTLQHYHAVKNSCVIPSEPVLSDFSLWLDQAYAEVTLSGERLNLYTQLHEELIQEIGVADYLIKLDCEPEELIRRIRNRGRPQEAGITQEYLTQIGLEIERQVEKAKLKGVPVHVINSQQFDFAHNGYDIESVLNGLKAL